MLKNPQSDTPLPLGRLDIKRFLNSDYFEKKRYSHRKLVEDRPLFLSQL